ncbi:SHOCT domain-containing protein [Methylopila sp. 73B]|uniref:SHOCT domain-containing protein n=1 Tax=Methylopila sp. 73B TaxID=1120792 RepID=UPI00037365C4|nr:SHOCT domain-containing protein [Methylopila sp. 73B]
MQTSPTDEGTRVIAEIAQRHGFGLEAGQAMVAALEAGAGAMAQFSHHELGGMGQWSRGGMLMIGDMFNNGLKARVGALADDLAAAMAGGAIPARRPAPGQSSAGFANWWPEELGAPSATGAQNGRRYAVFPAMRRLAIERDGRVRIYDTRDNNIGGAGQQQGGGDSLSFSTDRGSIGVHDLQEVDAQTTAAPEPTPKSSGGWQQQQQPGALQTFMEEPNSAPVAPAQPEEARAPNPRQNVESGDPIELIRKLAALKDAGALTEDEFQAKKIELLARI